jgi:hypothetical protein
MWIGSIKGERRFPREEIAMQYALYQPVVLNNKKKFTTSGHVLKQYNATAVWILTRMLMMVIY